MLIIHKRKSIVIFILGLISPVPFIHRAILTSKLKKRPLHLSNSELIPINIICYNYFLKNVLKRDSMVMWSFYKNFSYTLTEYNKVISLNYLFFPFVFNILKQKELLICKINSKLNESFKV